jgi:hypothetical protein
VTVTRSATIRYGFGTAPAVADGQSWVVDDTAVNIDASASGSNLTFSYVMSGEPAGSDLTINSSTGAITGTLDYANVGSSGSGTVTVTATDQYGATYQDTFTYSYALRAQATGGADLDLSFPEDSAITPTDLTANWTTNGNTLTYAITGTALPTGLSVSSAGSMTGTPTTVTADDTYTLRGTDEYGRITDDTFTLEITAVAAAPTLDSVVFTDNNDGTPAELAITYTGDVTGYRVYLATGDSTFDSDVPTDSELYNETGSVSGVLEYANFAVGSNIDITGLTSTSNSATRIAVRLIKSADGSGTSNAVVETVSGLDFTSPSFSSAEVGTIDADTLEITATETLFGTVDYTDFTLTGNTITAASLSGGKIRLTLGTTATSGDDYTGDLSYDGTGSALVDGDGNALTTFSSQDVTNNVSAASSPFISISHDGTGQTTYTFTNVTLPAGARIAVIAASAGTTARTLNSVTIDGVSATVRANATAANSKRMHLADTGTSTVTGGTNRTVSFTFSGAVGFRASFAFFDVSGLAYQANGSGNVTSGTSIAVDANTTAGDTLIAGTFWTLSGGTTVSGTGLDLDATENNESVHYMSALSKTAAAGGAPESLDINFTDALSGNGLVGVYR